MFSVPADASHTFSSAEWDWGYAHMCDVGRLRSDGFLGDDGSLTVLITGSFVISDQEVRQLAQRPQPTPAGMPALSQVEFLTTHATQP